MILCECEPVKGGFIISMGIASKCVLCILCVGGCVGVCV